MPEYNKFEILERIFMDKTDNGTQNTNSDIVFTLSDIKDAFPALGMSRPTSTSNFVLDLTRKDRGIAKRLPQSIINYGYDLRKKTGKVSNGNENYCGTFVYLGRGENGEILTLQDWLQWGEPDNTIILENKTPRSIFPYLSNDEGSIFSIVDYCDILSYAVFGEPNKIYRVQNPMKWQPNEIDGFYLSDVNGRVTVYPVETKASSTGDDINLVQMHGQYTTFVRRMQNQQMERAAIRPLAIKMESGGLNVAILENNPYYHPETNKAAPYFLISNTIRIELNPNIPSWN